ncbi:hypothetical protein B0A49_08776 [Cryomyces minteri]|uniref:Hypervirulence associated protein TUDOR domain-containing protein n=1 Tax=Cryomyces minteri TaxID=331657 RepID=A0A4U0WQR1_9PEZI|nr:hypothetical protein B0A49_08776 [Cryomyces minteri]
MTDKDIQKGDEVSWNWGAGKPSGTVAEVATEGEIAIKSNKGNTIKKNASAEDPAVHVARSGNDVVKRAHELTVDKKGPEHNGEKASEDKDGAHAGKNEKKEADKEEERKDADEKGDDMVDDPDKPLKKGGKAKAGAKRDAAAMDNGEKDDEDKKAEENGADDDGADEPPKKKGRGRPKGLKGAAKATTEKKKTTEAKKPANKKEPKKAATASGEPRRSGRNKA